MLGQAGGEMDFYYFTLFLFYFIFYMLGLGGRRGDIS